MASVTSQNQILKKLNEQFESLKKECEELKNQDKFVNIAVLRNKVKQYRNNFYADAKSLDSFNPKSLDEGREIISKMEDLVKSLEKSNEEKNNIRENLFFLKGIKELLSENDDDLLAALEEFENNIKANKANKQQVMDFQEQVVDILKTRRKKEILGDVKELEDKYNELFDKYKEQVKNRQKVDVSKLENIKEQILKLIASKQSRYTGTKYKMEQYVLESEYKRVKESAEETIYSFQLDNEKIDKNQSDTEVMLINLIDCIKNDYDSIKAKNVDEEGLLGILLKELEGCLDKYKKGKVNDTDTKELIDYVAEVLDKTFLYNASENMKKRQDSKRNKQQQNKNKKNDVALVLETLIGYMEEDYNLIKSRNVGYEGLLEILLKSLKDCLTNYNAGKIADKDVMDLVNLVVKELKNSFNYDVSKKAEKQINSEKEQQNNSNHTNSSNNSQTNKGANNRTNKTNNSNNNNKQKNAEIRKRYKVVNAKRSGLALGGIALGVWGAKRVFNTISLMINWGADLVSIPQLGVTAFMLLSGGALLKKAFFYRDKKLIKKTMEKAKDKSENNNKKENKGRRGRR